MGYTTDFSGEVTITPQLPDHYVAALNERASRRNNLFGDGDEGSFDHIEHGKWGYDGKGNPPPEGTRNRLGSWATSSLDRGHDGKRVSAVPSCWCQWMFAQTLHSNVTLGHSTLRWDGGEKFNGYAEWLQYVVNIIKRDHPKVEFAGVIAWMGEDDEDRGLLEITADGKVWKNTTVFTYVKEAVEL
mgnify:FL=1